MRKLKPGVQRLVGGKLAKLRLPLRYEPGAAPLTLDGDAYRGVATLKPGHALRPLRRRRYFVTEPGMGYRFEQT